MAVCCQAPTETVVAISWSLTPKVVKRMPVVIWRKAQRPAPLTPAPISVLLLAEAGGLNQASMVCCVLVFTWLGAPKVM
jgi:hypothetical protein